MVVLVCSSEEQPYCLVPKRAENQRLLFKFGGPLGEPTEPLVNQRPKILFKILVKTNEPLAFPYTVAADQLVR